MPSSASRKARRANAPHASGRQSTGNSTKRGAKNNSRAPGAQGEMKASSSASIISRAMPLFPYRTRKTVKYYSVGSITTGVSQASAYVFSANGIYDPDITGTGGQPMGFDQMMVFFNHYTVLRSRITATFSNTNTSLMPVVGVLVSGSSTVNTSYESIMENGDVEVTWLTTQGSGGSVSKAVRHIDAGKFQGVDDVMDDANMRGDAASNPTEQLYFHLVAWFPGGTAQPVINFQVLIEYETMFHEPRKATISDFRPGVINRRSSFDQKEEFTCLHVTEPDDTAMLTGDFSLIKVGCGCSMADHSVCPKRAGGPPVSDPCCCSNVKGKVCGVG